MLQQGNGKHGSAQVHKSNDAQLSRMKGSAGVQAAIKILTMLVLEICKLMVKECLNKSTVMTIIISITSFDDLKPKFSTSNSVLMVKIS